MPKIAVIGTTSWGITLGVLVARKKIEVNLWARTEQEAAELTGSKPNSLVPAGVQVPSTLSVTSSLEDAIKDAQAVILAVPSHPTGFQKEHLRYFRSEPCPGDSDRSTFGYSDCRR